MLSEAQTHIFKAPMLCIYPGAVLILLILGFGLMGDGLGDIKKAGGKHGSI